MKKFTTFCKMSLGALAVVIFYGCGTYNASSTSYVNGIYGRSERMTQKASQASSTKSGDQEQNAIRELPDSLAKYLNDSTYIPAPDSYEMKLSHLEEFRRNQHEDAHDRTREQVLRHPDDREVREHRRHDPDLTGKTLQQHVEDVDADGMAFVRRPEPADGRQDHRRLRDLHLRLITFFGHLTGIIPKCVTGVREKASD